MISHHTMDKNDIVREIRKLSVIERLGIVADLWDEIKESRDLESISNEDKQILLNRLANYRENPDSATDWKILEQKVRDRYDR